MDETKFPPTFKGRQYELRAMGLREFAGLRRDDEALDPFALAHFAKLMVIGFEQIKGLSEETREHLLGVQMPGRAGRVRARCRTGGVWCC